MDETNKKTKAKWVYGLLAGLVTYGIIGSAGLYLLRTFWADYALASVDKSYTFEMKLARLGVGLLTSTGAGMLSTRLANDQGKTAWWVGILVFCLAAYTHLVLVWADYPVWYHLAYLLPIIPLAGMSHYLVSKHK